MGKALAAVDALVSRKEIKRTKTLCGGHLSDLFDRHGYCCTAGPLLRRQLQYAEACRREDRVHLRDLLAPRLVDKVLLEHEYLSMGQEEQEEARAGAMKVGGILRCRGKPWDAALQERASSGRAYALPRNIINPYDTVLSASPGVNVDIHNTDEDAQAGPILLPVTNRGMLLFQLRELHHAITSSKVQGWSNELRDTLRGSAQSLCCSRCGGFFVHGPCRTQWGPTGQEQDNRTYRSGEGRPSVDWLVGFLACAAPDCFVGASLYPGAQVSHKGLGVLSMRSTLS